MSRVHDALRRGPRPALPPRPQRTAQSDAVIAALSYPSERPGSRRLLFLLAILGVALIGGATWMYWPAPEQTTQRPAPRPQAPAPASRQPAPAVAQFAPTPAPVAAAPNLPAAPAARPTPTQDPGPVTTRDPGPVTTRDPGPTPTRDEQPTPTTDATDFDRALYYQRSGEFELALVQYKKVL